MKHRSKSVELAARYVRSLIEDEPRQTLSRAPTHEPRLAELDGEAFVHCEPGCENVNPTGSPCAGGIERERQVVRVACVSSADARRGGSKPHIHAECGEIGQRRRGGRALRQMRRR